MYTTNFSVLLDDFAPSYNARNTWKMITFAKVMHISMIEPTLDVLSAILRVNGDTPTRNGSGMYSHQIPNQNE